ncbi:MAG TPA: AI-2E family transporter [Pyrinomonadaceae bacterium]
MARRYFRFGNDEGRSPLWWFRWVPTVAVAVITLYFLYVIGSVVIIPILASVALAYLLHPLVRRFELLGLSRGPAAMVSIGVVSLAIAAFFSYVLPDIWTQGSRAGQQIVESFTPENAARQRMWLRRFSPALERVAGEKVEQFLSDPIGFYDENVAEQTAATIDEEGNIKPARSGGAVILSTVVSSLDLLLVPFFVFYILLDFPRWRDSAEGLIPPRFRDPFSRLFDESGRILESYVRGQLLIAMIMAGCYAIGFFFLGVPAWAGIAMIAGFLNFIPYIGSILGFLLASVITLATGGGWWDVLGIVGVFVVVQSIEGYILTPKILGGRLNLHPMAVFLGLLVGGKLYGILGIIISIPAIAIGKVFLKFVNELYLASDFYRGRNSDNLADEPPEETDERIAVAAESALNDQREEEAK